MSRHGVTLMELLIVVVLVGILAGLAIWRLSSRSAGFSIVDCQYRQTAERTLRSILAAEQTYRQAEDIFTTDWELLPVRDVNARRTEDIPIEYTIANTTDDVFEGTATYRRRRPGRPDVSVTLRYDADQPNDLPSDPRESWDPTNWCP